MLQIRYKQIVKVMLVRYTAKFEGSLLDGAFRFRTPSPSNMTKQFAQINNCEVKSSRLSRVEEGTTLERQIKLCKIREEEPVH